MQLKEGFSKLESNNNQYCISKGKEGRREGKKKFSEVDWPNLSRDSTCKLIVRTVDVLNIDDIFDDSEGAEDTIKEGREAGSTAVQIMLGIVAVWLGGVVRCS